MSRVEQFLELVNNIDMAFAEMMEKVEPILLKNNLSNPNVTNFLFKL